MIRSTFLFQGWKDSTVLSSLVCSIKPDTLHLFSDTGCEYPETVSFVEEERRRGKAIVSVHPICRDGSVWTFERVVAIYGYPLFSKAIANGIRTYRHAKTPITKQHSLDYLERMYPQILPYLDCNISDLCCEKAEESTFETCGKTTANAMQHYWNIVGRKPNSKKETGSPTVLIYFSKRKIINAAHYHFGENKTFGIISKPILFPFQAYTDWDTNETAVCFVVLAYALNAESWG